MKGKLLCALFAAVLAMSFSRMPMMSAEATSLNVPEQYPVIQAVVTYTLTLHATPSTAGSIAASPSGSTYDSGTNVTLTARANKGYHFVHWEGDLSGSTNPTTIVMNGNKDVTAIFAQDQYTLAVSTNGQGTVTRTPDQPTYTYGTPVTLTTSAPVGWSFERWSGDLIGSTNPTTIPIHSNMAITANFIQDQYKLTIKTNGPGYVTKNPDQTTYTYGIVVTLSASPALGFESWSGDLSGSANPATIVMNGNKTVTATFNEARYTLTVSTTGQGSVARTPDQATYPIGTVVTLTASPATGWSFDRWSGDLSGSANPATIAMNGNKSVTASFIQNQYTLAVSISGRGSVSKSPAQPTYTYDTPVTLTASPVLPGWSFDHWSGDLIGNTNPTTIRMYGNMAITATFTQDQYTLAVSTTGQGTVTLTPAQRTYIYGNMVTLTASPATGWSFDRWSGDLSGKANPANITMNGNRTVTAVFTINTYTITASAGPGGSISPSGAVTLNYGTDQTFTISASSGYQIADVLVDGSSVGAVAGYTFTNVTASHSIVASFTDDTRTITASAGPGGSISPSGAVTVNHGADQTFNITPGAGYDIADVLVDGSSVGAVASYTFTSVIVDHTISASFAGIGLRSLKQGVLNDLTALRATVTSRPDAQKLDEAIKHLTRSLTPSWWVDSGHLQAKEGERVFNEEKDAVNQLRDLIKNRRSAVTDMALQAFVDRLVQVDRLLAEVAVTDAAGGDPKDIARANEQLGKGDADAAEGKYESAIEHYRNAWKHAQNAIKTGR